jgi:predicted nucleic acid-binding protein
MAYIDTSVLVAYYCPEPLSRAAEKSIRSAASPAISPLVEVELCSARPLCWASRRGSPSRRARWPR